MFFVRQFPLICLANYYCPSVVLDGRKREEYIQRQFPDYDEENFG
jgi:hypothetical protein